MSRSEAFFHFFGFRLLYNTLKRAIILDAVLRRMGIVYIKSCEEFTLRDIMMLIFEKIGCEELGEIKYNSLKNS